MSEFRVLEDAHQIRLCWGQGDWSALSVGSLKRLRTGLEDLRKQLVLPPYAAPGKGTPELLARFGRMLRDVCPRSVREPLDALAPGSTLKLQVEGNPALVPWELLDVENVPLGQRFVCCRAGSGEAVVPASRALVIADAEGLSDWSRAEARLVESTLRRSMPVDVWNDSSVTQARVLEALAAGTYGLVHWISYVDYDASSPWQSRLLLREGGLAAGLLKGLRTRGLGLVCLRLVGASSLLECADLWSGVFLKLGAGCVLGNGWDPSPAFSRSTFASFYAQLAEGSSVGQSLGRARQEGAEHKTPDPYASIHSLLLSGDAGVAFPSRRIQRATTLTTALKPGFRLVVTEGPEEGREIPLYTQALAMRPSLTVGGRGLRPGEIELDDPELSGPLVELEYADGQMHLSNSTHDPARVRVNGLGLGRRLTLQGQELIEMGQSTLRFEVLGVDPSPPVAAREGAESRQHRYALECVAGLNDDLDQVLDLDGSFAVVGRLPECSFRLHDRSVSRHQFSLTRRDGDFYLHHLGSNPSILNGVEVAQEKELKHGDLIQVGSHTTLRFFDSAREPGS